METRYWGALLAAAGLTFVSVGLGAYLATLNSGNGYYFKDLLPLLSTITGGVGTVLALAIAYQANKISRDSAAAQLRSHIFVSKNKIYSVDDAMYIGCEFQNSGISPAIDVQVDFQFAIGSLDYRIGKNALVRFTTSGIIAPGALISVDRPMNILNAENIAQIRNGKMGVFMRAIVSYSWVGADGRRDGFDVTYLCDGDYLDRGLFRSIT